jgi:hypothetical protein
MPSISRLHVGFSELICVFVVSAVGSCLVMQEVSAQATGRPSQIPAPVQQVAYVEESIPLNSGAEPYFADDASSFEGRYREGDETPARGWVPNDQRLDWAARTGAWDRQPISPAHTVIRPPKPTAGSGVKAGVHSGSHAGLQAGATPSARSVHVDPPKYPVVDGYRSLHHGVVDRHAAIPGAAAPKTAWKQPYSYGYFGASGKRHWSKHHGYRDRVTEWRYQ